MKIVTICFASMSLLRFFAAPERCLYDGSRFTLPFFCPSPPLQYDNRTDFCFFAWGGGDLESDQVFIKSTAGMRLLPREIQDAIHDEIYAALGEADVSSFAGTGSCNTNSSTVVQP